MPDLSQYDNQDEWMKVCVPKMMDEGKDNSQAVAACMNMWQMKGDAMKYRSSLLAVKAVGDWELDVTAVPFGSRDSDGQWFDPMTDIMNKVFTTPLAVYQHGMKRGARELQDKPLIIGDSVAGSLEKQADGWHVRIALKSDVKEAQDIMNAARQGAAAVSSGSIPHLSRLEVGGKYIQYDKRRPGRIAVWPLAEVSLWERGNGNANPANKFAVALPVVKAMYREAGIPFPEIDTHGAAEAELVKRRAEVKNQAQKILEKLKKDY